MNRRRALSIAAALVVAGCAHAPLREPMSLPHPATLRAAFEGMRGRGGASRVRSLDDRAAAWAARWRALDDAKRTIDASYFIVDLDVFGLAFLGHLYERAKAGVEVRLLIDGRGSVALATPFFGLDELQEIVATGNGDIRVYNPPITQIAQSLFELSAVPASAGAHEKILVVDEKTAIVGGRNIASTYFASHAENPAAVEDADVLIEGDGPVDQLVSAIHHDHGRAAQDAVHRDMINWDSRADFLMMAYRAMDAWLRGTIAVGPGDDVVAGLEAASIAGLKTLPSHTNRDQLRPFLVELARDRSVFGALLMPIPPADNAELRVVASKSRAEMRDENANEAVIRSIGAAEHRLLFESPYFMMTPRMLAALEAASARGVAITVITNGPLVSDNAASQALFIDTWPELEARMPTLRVYATADFMLHTKRIVVDDMLTLVGSHNFDPLSSHLNSEVIVAIWSQAVNASASAYIDGLVAGGALLEYRVARDENGAARRGADGTPVVAFGPRNHVPRAKIEELESLKQLLFSVRGIFDFEFVVW